MHTIVLTPMAEPPRDSTSFRLRYLSLRRGSFQKRLIKDGSCFIFSPTDAFLGCCSSVPIIFSFSCAAYAQAHINIIECYIAVVKKK